MQLVIPDINQGILPETHGHRQAWFISWWFSLILNLCTLSSALPDGQYETARFVDLPVEVIKNIVFWLPKASLLHLCAASRALYLQAAQFLFHNVKLHDSQNQQILLWSQLISENNHLVQSVKSLSLPLVLGGEDLRHRHRVEELHGALFRALRCLDNLGLLEILESNRNCPTILLTTILSHIDVNLFLGCNFRLKSFGYGGFPLRRAVLADEPWTSADLTTFLREQDQITSGKSKTHLWATYWHLWLSKASKRISRSLYLYPYMPLVLLVVYFFT